VTAPQDNGRYLTGSNAPVAGDLLYAPADYLQAGTYEDVPPAVLQTMLEFVNSKQSAHTQRKYSRQIEKFLVWLRYKQFPNLSVKVLEKYCEDVKSPPAELLAYVDTHCPQVHFGPTKAETVDQYFDVIRGLIRYLHDDNQIPSNPARKVKRQGINNPQALNPKRHFSDDQWEILLNSLDRLPEQTPGQRNVKERLRFGVRFQYAMALRIHEMTTHTHQDIRCDHGVWRLYIVGKGRSPRVLTLNEVAWEALTRYRLYLGLSAEPGGESLPLLPKKSAVKKRHGHIIINPDTMTEANWQKIFRDFLQYYVVPSLVDGDGVQNATFQRDWAHYSTHTLRHTRITHLIEKEQRNLLWVQKFAGHRALSTTARYYHTDT
jgi:site-specific recombinase XerD